MGNANNRKVVSADVAFDNSADAQAFCAHWSKGTWKASIRVEAPDLYIVSVADPVGSEAIPETMFAGICVKHNAVSCVLTSWIGLCWESNSDPNLRLTPADDEIPPSKRPDAYRAKIEAERNRAALRLHIHRLMAEKFLAVYPMSDAGVWAGLGKSAGKAATDFADAMQAELDAADVPDPETVPDA